MANNSTGTVNDPYIIADWNITGSTIYGIYITGTTKHFRIENCWIVNSAHHGIFVDDVTSGTATICNNTCNDNGDDGIYLGYSSSLTVANNSCNINNKNGIYPEGSGSSTIINNTCNNNDKENDKEGISSSSSSLISRIGLFLFILSLLLVMLVLAKKSKR
ncbi:MAG: right-handed parallel beta-helix repeat-containing protein [Candidatus Hodarchaeota archaeon]